VLLATGVMTLPSRAAAGFASRICQATGLVVDVAAEKVIAANVVAAIVFMVLGGVSSVLVELTRAEWLQAMAPGLYYRALTLHGMNMLIYWIIFFEVACLYFGCSIVLNSRLVGVRLAWGAFGLMLAGALLTNATILAGQGDVLFTSYVPLKASPLFYLGTILFAIGALIACGVFFASILVARAERTYEGSVPLVTFGLITAAIIAVVTLIGGVFTYVPAFFWSLGLMNLDPEVYRLNYWSLGHPAQQINLAAMVTVWYMTASLTTGARPLNEKLSRFAFLLYLFFINLGSVHHLLVDPGLTRVFKVFNTSYAMYLAVLGSMIHAFSIPAAIEIALRAQGHRKGLFGWLRKAPWGNPAFSATILSMALFGFVGGTTGVIFGHEQINMVHHNTLDIPAHFHATVVAGTTLAFMGVTYYLLPLVLRREVLWPRLARVQPYVYAVGCTLHIAGMMIAGSYGVPRRTASLAVENAQHLFAQPAYWGLALLGVGGTIAAVGGVIYVAVVVASVLFGRQVPASAEPFRLAPVHTVGGVTVTSGVAAKEHSAPGALVLVFVFLAFFILVWFLNMWRLASVWPVS